MSVNILLVEGHPVALDSEGFLRALSDWSEAAATELALQEGIALSEAHWEIIRLVQDFYSEFEISPAMRPLIKYITQKLGTEKGRSLYLLKLFPQSPAKLISKIAGLPKPSNCL